MAKSQVGSGSLGFKKATDMPSALARIISNYTEFESQSIAHSYEWRNKHSARNLVRRLANCVPARKFGFSESLETFDVNL